MNYRHAFHAGNHTEVFKHALLVELLLHLRRKPAPFVVLDTHAGLGAYDLHSAQALRTGEAQDGIGRVFGRNIEAAQAYLDVVQGFTGEELRKYPGSPRIALALMRPADRLIACELHDEDVGALRREIGGDGRAAVHHRDGYEAMRALLPPPERRGLVFVDPPFEERDEALRLGRALAAAISKWPTGIYAAWHPVKDRSVSQALERALEASPRPCLRTELLIAAENGRDLVGGGLIIINPPWRFEETLRRLGAELLRALGAETGSFDLRWIRPPG